LNARKIIEVCWAKITSCTRYFQKSRLNARVQMEIDGTNPGLCSVFHIEALGRGNILASYVQFLDVDATHNTWWFPMASFLVSWRNGKD